MSRKLFTPVNISVFAFCAALSLNVFGSTVLSCSITADDFPDLGNGLLANETVKLNQHRVDAATTVLDSTNFIFKVVPGRIKLENDRARVLDYYLEIQDAKGKYAIRSASASFAGGRDFARMELVTYPEGSDWYEGIVIFECAGVPPM